MSDSPEPKRVEGWPAHPWENIETRYREDAAMWPWLSPRADLVTRIRQSGIGRSLHALTSMHTMRCMMHETIYFHEPALVVAPAQDATYTLTFEHPSQQQTEDWRATYRADDLAPAFGRFLIRVGWVPEGHPAHKVLLGGAP